MNSGKNENSKSNIKSNEVNEEKLSPAPSGENATICSDLKMNTPAESPKAPEEQVDNIPAAHDSSPSSKNPPQPEACKDQSLEEEQNSVAHPTEAVRTGQPSIRKGTGPRTAQGKQRSKLNALKHGLLSKAVLLKGESRPEFLSLLNGLRDDLQPQGKLETVLVENLAALLWRKSRLLQAENAEISENSALVVHNSLVKRYAEAWESSGVAPCGLFKHISNPLIVGEAKETLVLLRRMFTTEGFTGDLRLVEKLTGEHHNGGILQSFLAAYRACAAEAGVSEKIGDTSTKVNLSTIMVPFIDAKIERLKELEKGLLGIEVQRLAFKLSAAVIPGQEVLDRLLRYETHLSREIDRILNQLERLQRMRKGQPPPPQVDVKIS